MVVLQAPDAQLQKLCEARFARLREAGADLDALCAGADGDEFRAALTALCIGSDWALELLTRNPDMLLRLRETDAHRLAPDAEALRAEFEALLATLPVAADEHRPDGPLGLAVRDFRNRHQIGILMRDLAGVADLAATTAILSDLAEVVIDVTLARLHALAVATWGDPRDGAGATQRLLVLAMGKLGARELNLSSDVDLIFAYPEAGSLVAPDGSAGIPVQEFFIRLGRWLIGLLDTHTARGFVFRIDMRLRPFGDSGPLVHSVDALLDYYEEQGRDWERYALIKARVISGDPAAGRQLLRDLRPFVYRRYLDFGAIEALRQMKALIRGEVRRRRLQDDVKLGEGGIREVEFIAQVFQLIHGGRDVRFQDRRLRVILPRLAEAGFLPAADVDELSAAYAFLRDLEHRLQAFDDAQTQRLPADAERRHRLAWSMGQADWEALRSRLDGHRGRVAAHFAELIQPLVDEDDAAGAALRPWAVLWAELGGTDAPDAGDLQPFEAAGFADSAAALARLQAMRLQREDAVTQDVGRARLDALVPRLMVRVAAAADPDRALARCLRLVDAVLRRTAYLVLLVENPGALDQLVRLVSASDWIGETLVRHPILLDELLDARQLYTAPTHATLRRDLEETLWGIPEDDLEQQMEQLRYFKEATELRVAACEMADTLPLMKVSDALTWLAEVILERVVALAWRQTVAQYGRPRREDGTPCDEGFGVIGYGKLGGLELGWGSDLDLVFVHDLPAAGTTDGERAVVNGQFFARLGQRVIHLLTTRTLSGELYEVDMRLRPSGRAGLLVTSLDAFADYQRTEAWTWEHQALFRARPVVGAESVRAAFAAIRAEIVGRERDRARLRDEIVAMRRRMLAELGGLRERPDAAALAARTEVDLKQGPGAVVDIEFMVQFVALGWARAHPELLQYTDAIRTLETAQAAGIVAADDATLLIESYKEFRVEAHRRALDNKPARTDRPELIARANEVAAVWVRWMQADVTGA
ncbi:MAG TPA: bifunctional [glutamate--ammonia ligase]-adenylyl-L-tyrosine phosphorylase/[glutamate--ammonia-ligase] adenylyltransferase [Pseudomonadales bacterium]|nr:bifunctional [glutamate--ammonia ligase]-adenylyl-L-tyrosine phosphorylase/[glutamate--ammonia-ligase] adenylyltransferase [Pseudomonadales bacterium]